MRKFSGEICGENQGAILFSINLFTENRAIYEIKWKNVVQPDRPQMTI
jgi:hypothetical protein